MTREIERLNQCRIDASNQLWDVWGMKGRAKEVWHSHLQKATANQHARFLMALLSNINPFLISSKVNRLIPPKPAEYHDRALTKALVRNGKTVKEM